VSRERSQTKPPPATNVVANAERHDQLPGNGEKNEKPAFQLTDIERPALFDDFLKWYLTVRPNHNQELSRSRSLGTTSVGLNLHSSRPILVHGEETGTAKAKDGCDGVKHHFRLIVGGPRG
jgi:hypothetical protein